MGLPEQHEFLLSLSRSGRRIFSKDERIYTIEIGRHFIKGTAVGGDEFGQIKAQWRNYNVALAAFAKLDYAAVAVVPVSGHRPGNPGPTAPASIRYQLL